MINYREILRLYSLGTSQRSIAQQVQSSQDTVADIIKSAEAAGISWSLGDDVTNEMIQELLFTGKYALACPNTQPDFLEIHNELAKHTFVGRILRKGSFDRCNPIYVLADLREVPPLGSRDQSNHAHHAQARRGGACIHICRCSAVQLVQLR